MNLSQSNTVQTKKLKAYTPLLASILILIVAQLGISLYLVALPEIALFYKTDQNTVAATLYAYLLPYGVSQLLFSVVSLRLGFNKSICIGFAIYCLGIVILIFSTNIELFTFSRVIQGFGAGILSIIVKLTIKDKYKGNQINIAFSYLEMFATITPALAPLLGSFLIKNYEWRFLFVFMLLLAGLIFFIVYLIKIKLTENSNLSIVKGFKDYGLVIQSKKYLLSILAILLVYSTILIYLSGSSFLFISKFRLSPSSYGYVMILPAIGTFLGSNLSAWMINKSFSDLIFKIGLTLTFLSGFFMIVGYAILNTLTWVSLLISILSIVLISISYGLLFPNIIAKIIKLKLGNSGADIALASSIQLIGASIINLLLTQVQFDWQLMMGVLFMIVGAILVYLLKRL
ncbi:MFS transporter [Aquimarina muelleri]|uniref:Bcr/CflA family drug resistance efflux transporter n=1 Tax=Aquimarina muelleri TaxID=279356 RepID=A0A918JW37_9FLAO|nr:MFS transporter [Aquimarina muelleri]MCX2762822.1 MFS transporter [Aquimarina muelleri]GGX11691.1 Bcr/CflA family drug resistance efflux transporter [Aquimarina muelleri]